MSQLDVAKHYAAQALKYDQTGHFKAASYFYLVWIFWLFYNNSHFKEASRVINEAIKTGIAPGSLIGTANKYLHRAEKLAQEGLNLNFWVYENSFV